MKWKVYGLPLIILVFFQPAMAGEPVQVIRDYVKAIYGKKLVISDEQIEQLSWVIENPVHTPEMDAKAKQNPIHREVPRALSRLYSLQLLRSGTRDDYQAFVAPQADSQNSRLNRDSFNQMAKLIGAMDAVSYELASEASVKRILGSEKPLVVDINPENGLATLK